MINCQKCNIEMKPDGNGIRCPNCGNWIAALELKYGKEPIIPPDKQAKTRWNWH